MQPIDAKTQRGDIFERCLLHPFLNPTADSPRSVRREHFGSTEMQSCVLCDGSAHAEGTVEVSTFTAVFPFLIASSKRHPMTPKVARSTRHALCGTGWSPEELPWPQTVHSC